MRKNYPIPGNSDLPSASERAAGGRIGRFLGYLFLALSGLAVGFFIYFFILMGQPLRTRIAIVDTFEPISLDAVSLEDEDGNAVSWEQGGRTRVYVHESFPIRKVAQKDPDIENILVFGVDSRGSGNIVSRADAMIVVTVDKTHKSIKLTSLMRDTRVDIAGRSQPNRLNTAYAYGGVGLLINTINDTFDLDIQRFAMFDFWSAASLIDALGGVELDIRSEEIPYLNANLNEMNRLTGQNSPQITEAGNQELDGQQAISWARIRKLDSDYVRTSRQRTVMMTLIGKYSDATISSLVAMTSSGLAAFETNMKNADLIRLGINALPLTGEILEYRVPADGMYRVNPNPWMMIVDLDRQVPALHAFIYGDR